MTRDDLIKFLEGTYAPDTELVWQTMCFDDVENGIEGATKAQWTRFVEQEDNYNSLAEQFSENTFTSFFDFVEAEADVPATTIAGFTTIKQALDSAVRLIQEAQQANEGEE